MKTLFVNIRYLIVPIMSIGTIYGLIIGGLYIWTGVFLFGLCIILDTITKNIHLKADFDKNGNSYGIKSLQYAIMYLMLFVFIALQLALAWRIYQYVNTTAFDTSIIYGLTIQNGITTINLIGAVISAGLWQV